MAPTTYNFTTLKVSRPREFVVHVELNRPQRLNAMNAAFWGYELNLY
jgi:delta(3,5)-delta(2,4)-dienoyl-CoA isomerase